MASIKVFWVEPVEPGVYGFPDGSTGRLAQAPVGAMWDASWYPAEWNGDDGIALIVKTPGGDWFVDGRASNCTRPYEWERKDGGSVFVARPAHRCWIRHGDPRTGNVTVDKNGVTCGAGAGSILAGKYHGFLKDGLLTNG